MPIVTLAAIPRRWLCSAVLFFGIASLRVLVQMGCDVDGDRGRDGAALADGLETLPLVQGLEQAPLNVRLVAMELANHVGILQLPSDCIPQKDSNRLCLG